MVNAPTGSVKIDNKRSFNVRRVYAIETLTLLLQRCSRPDLPLSLELRFT